MVSSSYLLHRPPPPSGMKRFFDQKIMPAAIDGGGQPGHGPRQDRRLRTPESGLESRSGTWPGGSARGLAAAAESALIQLWPLELHQCAAVEFAAPAPP